MRIMDFSPGNGHLVLAHTPRSSFLGLSLIVVIGFFYHFNLAQITSLDFQPNKVLGYLLTILSY